MDYSPVYGWSWNSPMSEKLIVKQLDEMCQMGIRGMYILPLPREFRPTTMRTQMKPDYLSEDFFSLVTFALMEAKKRGMNVWVYDEGGWPSGGACTQVMKLRPASVARYIAKTENGYEIRTSDSVLPSALDPEAMALYQHITHDRYAEAIQKAGITEPLYFFDDEPYTQEYPYFDGMDALFEKQYVYSFMEHLDEIFDTESDHKERADYKEFIGRLFDERFLLSIREKCHALGHLSVGHLSPDHHPDGVINRGQGSMVSSLRCFDVPFIDDIWRQNRHPDDTCTGEDDGGKETCIFFGRFASSAASQNGGNEAGCESYCIYSSALTPERMIYDLGFLLARGINILNPLSLPSARNGMTVWQMRPGFIPGYPADFTLKDFNEIADRMCRLMHEGKPLGKTALYLPVRDMCMSDARRRRITEAFRNAGNRLEDSGVDFDIIDDAVVREAEYRDGKLCIGLAAYEKVILPEGCEPPQDVYRKVQPLLCTETAPEWFASKGIVTRVRGLDNGGRIFFVFNSNKETFDRVVKKPVALPGYEVDFVKNKTYALNDEICISLVCGEAKAYIFDAAGNYEVSERFCGNTVLIPEEIKVKPVYECMVDENGLSRKALTAEYEKSVLPVEWKKGFSGEISCVLKFPKHGSGHWRLSIEKLYACAGVYADGKPVGNIIAAPYTIEGFGSTDEIELRIANTLAPLISTTDFFDRYSEADIGPYHEKMLPFEREALPAALDGIIKLEIEE